MRRSGPRIAALAALLIASSCGGGGVTRGVRVDQINTNVGLGIEAPLNAAPANIAITRPIPHGQIEDLTPPTIPPFETARPVVTHCPTAGDFDFPAIEAGVEPDPKVRPAETTYRYKLDGTVLTDEGPEKIDAFETRRFSKVVPDSNSPNAYDFTMTQTQLLDERSSKQGYLETTYRVVPTGNTRNVPNPPAAAANVSDAGRGVFIIKIVFHGYDDRGRPTSSSFDPSPPIQILAFPVEAGAAIDSTGTDSQHGSSLQIKGSVKGKKQIDACGHRVDSWLVDAEETYRYTDPDTLQTNEIDSNYDYGMAPQYGSIVIFEHVVAPKDGPVINLSSRVGEVPRRAKAGG